MESQIENQVDDNSITRNDILAPAILGEKGEYDLECLRRGSGNDRIQGPHRTRVLPTTNSVKRRLGWWTLFSLIPGSIVILGVHIWVLFLWLNKPTTTSTAWRWLVVNDHVNVAVTISSTILRSAMSLQAVMCTKMIAGIAIECYDTLFHRSSSLSMLRAYGTNPFGIILNWPFHLKSWLLAAFTVSFTIITFGTTFISTLLVSDLHLALLPGFAHQGALPFRITASSTSKYPPDWSSFPPVSFPTFAEWSSSTPVPETSGIDDTGLALRAILPISSATTRETVKTYNGPATIVYPRVICMRPNISDLAFGTDGNGGGAVLGHISPPGEVPGIANRTLIDDLSFNCSIHTSQDCLSPAMFAMSLCEPDAKVSLTDMIDGGRNFPNCTASMDCSDSWYLVMNYTNFTGTNVDTRSNFVKSNSTQNFPWITFSSQEQPEAKVDITYCLSSFESIEANIIATSDTNRTEPLMNTTKTFVNGTCLGVSDISEVLRQYNSTSNNYSAAERGIMTLSPEIDYKYTNLAAAGFQDVIRMRWLLQIPSDAGNSSRSLCNSSIRTPDPLVGFNEIFIQAFQSSIRETKSPAKSLQTLHMMMVMNQYYNSLPEFDTIAATSNTMFEQHLLPSSSLGLIVVSILIVLHMLHVALITKLFLTRTKFTMLGESWSAVSQLYSEDTTKLLGISRGVTDDDVKKWAKEKGLGKAMVRLQECTNVHGEEDGTGFAKISRVGGDH